VEVDVVVVVVVDVVVADGHWPFTGRTSPWRRCAFNAFREIVIRWYWRFFDRVRWHTWTFLPAGVVVVVELVLVEELDVEDEDEVEAAPLPFPLPFPGGLPLPGAGPATATDAMRPAMKNASREAFSFITTELLERSRIRSRLRHDDRRQRPLNE
jgi:hypothetical protein